MGGIPSKKGVTIEFYDENGNPDPHNRPLTFKLCYLTGQNNPTAGQHDQDGSRDWVKEVYLANSEIDLYNLIHSTKDKDGNPVGYATGYHPPLTSGSSRNVMVYRQGEAPKQWHSVIATTESGDPKDVKWVPNPAGGPAESLIVIGKLKVTEGDASKDNLSGYWKKWIPFLSAPKQGTRTSRGHLGKTGASLASTCTMAAVTGLTWIIHRRAKREAERGRN